MKRVPLMMSVGIFAVLTSQAGADNTTCTNADFLPFGEVRSDSVSDTATNAWYRVKVYEDRSYAFLSWAPVATAGDEVAAVTLSINLLADDCVTPLVVAGTGISDREGNPDATGHNGGYFGMVLGDSACGTAGVVDSCTARVQVTQTGLTGGQSMTLNTVGTDTTLHSPYWQVVTAAGYDAAPQFRVNNGTNNQAFRFIAYNGAGAKVCTHEPPAPSNGLATFAMSSTCAISTGFGSAVLLHIGPPGTASGNITTFSGSSGLSFDAPFFPKMSWGTH